MRQGRAFEPPPVPFVFSRGVCWFEEFSIYELKQGLRFEAPSFPGAGAGCWCAGALRMRANTSWQTDLLKSGPKVLCDERRKRRKNLTEKSCLLYLVVSSLPPGGPTTLRARTEGSPPKADAFRSTSISHSHSISYLLRRSAPSSRPHS